MIFACSDVSRSKVPVLNAVDAQSTLEDTAKTLTLLGTYSVWDTEGSSLTYSATSSTSNVVVSISGSTLTLTPAANWDGTATITAKVNNGITDSVAQTFVLTVYAFQSGDGFNGKVYLTVTSPDTGRVWLDRNLGATQVCTSSTDSDCYGYVYQWGRNDDGHESRSSAVTTTLASTITPGTDTFIISTDPNNDWTTADSLGSSRTSAWIDAGVNDVCPTGYSVPTEAELTADTTEATTTDITDAATAYSSFLKLPVGGDRVAETGNMARVDSFGWLWTRSILDEARALGYNAGIATFVDTDKGISLSVRCIKDL
jgi:uncharacterized protein (TIGR02145 family)